MRPAVDDYAEQPSPSYPVFYVGGREALSASFPGSSVSATLGTIVVRARRTGRSGAYDVSREGDFPFVSFVSGHAGLRTSAGEVERGGAGVVSRAVEVAGSREPSLPLAALSVLARSRFGDAVSFDVSVGGVSLVVSRAPEAPAVFGGATLFVGARVTTAGTVSHVLTYGGTASGAAFSGGGVVAGFVGGSL